MAQGWGTFIGAQGLGYPHQSSGLLRAGPMSSIVYRKPPVSVSRFLNLDNKAIDPSPSNQAPVSESLAGSMVISGQVRRNKGLP